MYKDRSFRSVKAGKTRGCHKSREAFDTIDISKVRPVSRKRVLKNDRTALQTQSSKGMYIPGTGYDTR